MPTTNPKKITEQGVKLREIQLPVDLDLRDYFAAQAMGGCLANPELYVHMAEIGATTVEIQQKTLASGCYKIADAMLAERQK